MGAVVKTILKMMKQQRLFEHYNPMEERLSKEFFNELPAKAGIYKMYGAGEDLLYVGKAKNLRNRLFTYRRAKMNTASRKTVRLIRMTHQVEVTICETEKEALLLENKLIRKHQPEFNYAKKQPETYYFIALQSTKSGLKFSLQMHVPDKELVFGAFKGHRIVRKTVGGIIRILYMLENRVESAFDLPSILTQKLTPMKYELTLSEETATEGKVFKLLTAFLSGENKKLITWIMRHCKKRGLLESFAGSMILDDLEAMKWFYERCSHRNYQIDKQFNRDKVLIPQQELDDLLVEWVFAREV